MEIKTGCVETVQSALQKINKFKVNTFKFVGTLIREPNPRTNIASASLFCSLKRGRAIFCVCRVYLLAFSE